MFGFVVKTLDLMIQKQIFSGANTLDFLKRFFFSYSNVVFLFFKISLTGHRKKTFFKERSFQANLASRGFESSVMIRAILETFRSGYKYEIEYEYDFSSLVLMFSIITFHSNLVPICLLCSWSAKARSEGT